VKVPGFQRFVDFFVKVPEKCVKKPMLKRDLEVIGSRPFGRSLIPAHCWRRERQTQKESDLLQKR